MRVLLAIEHAGYANERLTPHVIIDEAEYEAARKRMRYHKRKTKMGTAYLAVDEKTGFADYFFHTPDNERGYGGAMFRAPLKGSRKVDKVRGPWSSRSGVMNRLFDQHVIEVTVITGTGCFSSGAMELQALKKHLHGYSLVVREPQHKDDTDLAYELVKS